MLMNVFFCILLLVGQKKLETVKVHENKNIHLPCKVCDVRFPTSLEADGSDAIHPDPDYSAW